MSPPATLADAACRVLNEPDPGEKVRLSHLYATAWRDGNIVEIGDCAPPARPARPACPVLTRPGDMPKRTKGEHQGRVNLIHAIAHIELNAIDLGWDAVARFAGAGLPRAYFDDWVQVAEDEARHFTMLRARLLDLGADYGDLPAHDGLWEAAANTADDVLARMALLPMLLEARGLDTTPATVARLDANGDPQTATIMAEIGEDEVRHVAAGVRWFEHVCGQRGLSAAATFHDLVRARFKGRVKPPFNIAARTRAGMARDYYEPLAHA
ncbi:MAG: ferritin-like domain-containing protein [Alphaproteobacteria bacterium]|nr:ferritin-like domain-containing protein [Alphaproteobacteria bacterium]